MAKKKNKKIKSKPKKEKKMKLGTFKETAREKLIGQHIGYRYDVNLLPEVNLHRIYIQYVDRLIFLLQFL